MGSVSCYENTTSRIEVEAPLQPRSHAPNLLQSRRAEKSAELVLGFELPDGTPKHVVSSQRPMGLKYSKTTPLTVTDVNTFGHAKDLGVKKGWKLRFIDEEDVSGRDGDFIRALLCKRANILPLL